MTALARNLDPARVRRAIDWSVFGAGAVSLALALALTISGLLSADPAVAQAPATPEPVTAQPI